MVLIGRVSQPVRWAWSVKDVDGFILTCFIDWLISWVGLIGYDWMIVFIFASRHLTTELACSFIFVRAMTFYNIHDFNFELYRQVAPTSVVVSSLWVDGSAVFSTC